MNWDFLMVVTVQKELLTLTDFQTVVMTVRKVNLTEIQELTRTVEEMQAQLQPKDKELQELRAEIRALQEKKDNEIQLIKTQLATVEKHQMEIIAHIM